MSKTIENSASNNNHNTNEQSNAVFIAQQQMLIAQMQQNQMQVHNDEINLGELWNVIWAKKLIIIIVSSIFFIGSVLFALSMPNVYKASAILAPVSSDSGAGGLGALAGQFGGLASMAGIDLGGGGIDKPDLALEILQSRSFIENYIAKHELLIPIMAGKDWNLATDTLILDAELYDEVNDKWIRDVKPPQQKTPSSWEAYVEFSELLNISQDKATSIITIEIEYFSPSMAQQWLTWLIKDINEVMRQQDQKEAQDSIDYLIQQLETIQVSTMEAAFYQLIEEQTKNMMLTKVKAEYVLKTIDPPQVPDDKSGPMRALIVVLGTILGGMLSVLIVLIRHFSKKTS